VDGKQFGKSYHPIGWPFLFGLDERTRTGNEGSAADGGAPRSEFEIIMIAGGNHTTIH